MPEKPTLLISGASRGLGAETAVAAAQLGADLVLTARNEEGLTATAERVASIAPDTSVKLVPGDLASPDFCAKLAETLGGRLAGLVLNAAMIEPVGSVVSLDADVWEKALNVNLMAPFRLAKHCLPALKQSGGRLITVGTGASTQPLASWSAYCSSKAGLLMLTRVIAVENPDITAISVRPGVVDTAMQCTIREHKDAMPADLAAYFQNIHDTGQLEPPEVPGRAIAWCALQAPRDWSGLEVSYSQPEVATPVKAAFLV